MQGDEGASRVTPKSKSQVETMQHAHQVGLSQFKEQWYRRHAAASCRFVGRGGYVSTCNEQKAGETFHGRGHQGGC
jgi:hypothetical protein